jgi:hypothetical protein
MRLVFLRKQTGQKKIIILSGPPKAGKSRLRSDIYNLLREDKRINWFVVPASPDMEGQWVGDSWERGEERGKEAEELARRYKRKLKETGAFFSEEWVERMRRQIEGLSRWTEVLVLDLGGLPSEENKRIVSSVLGSGYIIPVVLLGEDGNDGGWTQFWRDLGYEPVVTTYHPDLALTLINFVT